MVQSSNSFQILCPGIFEDEEGDSAGVMECKDGGIVTMEEIEGILGPDSPDLLAYVERASLTADTNHNTVTATSQENKRKLDVPTTSNMAYKHQKTDHVYEAKDNSLTNAKEVPGRTAAAILNADNGFCSVALLKAQIASQCSFCASELPIGQGIILQGCWHVFCRHCLVQTVRGCKGIQVNCPFPRAAVACAGRILDKEVKALVSEAEYEVYMGRSLKEAEKRLTSYHCKTLRCTGFCEVEVNNNKTVFLCSVCQKLNCLKCQVVHDGIDCARYQELSAQMTVHARRNRRSIDRVVREDLTAGFDQLSQLMQGTPASPLRKNDVSQNSILERMEKLELYPSTKKFECPICMTDIRIGKGIILRDCLHTFCRTCLVSTINHSEDPAVKCPYMDGNYSCTSYLAPREIKALLPVGAHEAFINRSVRLAELVIPNTFHCKTTDCTGWCETNETSRFFLCPVCDKVNCLSCRALHESYTCEQYAENLVKDADNRKTQAANERKGEAYLEKELKSKKFVRCPRCKIVCQKISGCEHVTCGACKLAFNWTGK